MTTWRNTLFWNHKIHLEYDSGTQSVYYYFERKINFIEVVNGVVSYRYAENVSLFCISVAKLLARVFLKMKYGEITKMRVYSFIDLENSYLMLVNT